jgi:hypothetical protein
LSGRAHTPKRRSNSRSRRGRDGHRFESPQLQEVCANPRDFLLYRIARHFRRLPTPFPGLPAPSCHAKPYVRSNKSDQVDAAAIYEAMSRPGQRFMPVRSIANQAEVMHHRAREFLAGQRTAALNALRGHLAEIGLIAPQGAQHAYGLKRMAADGFNENGEIVVPDCVRGALRSLVGQIDALDEAIGAIDRELATIGRSGRSWLEAVHTRRGHRTTSYEGAAASDETIARTRASSNVPRGPSATIRPACIQTIRWARASTSSMPEQAKQTAIPSAARVSISL